jgi:HlyD family secretion protein
MTRRIGIITTGLLAATGLTLGAFHVRKSDVAPALVTAQVSRGSIASEIAATGTLEAVTTVQVGTQVSGTIQALSADFNSIVRKGQLLARLDPSLFQTQVDSARASLTGAEANLARMQVVQEDADTKARRARELSARQLLPATDLDAAETTLASAAAQVKSAAAQVTQARASLKQAEVNLAKTIITSPIDGIVIARSVDVGQTVAASLSAPTLFTLAADLSEMQVKASIDESDLGAVREGQPVSFRVDAYPNSTFAGHVTQIRLEPVVSQNVVTYDAIITAPNPSLELKPGMTANVTIETARRDDILRVPSAALRFKPTMELLASLGQQAPAALTAGGKPAPGTGTVWVVDGQLEPVTVSVGITDGAFTEISAPQLQDGAEVATRINDAGSAQPSPAAASNNPLMGTPPRRR